MIGFDTLKAMESLRESGFEETQARAVVDTFKDAVGGSVATKIDLQEAKGELRAEIQEVRTELQAVEAGLRAEIQGVKSELQVEMQALRGDVETSIARVEARSQTFTFVVGLGLVGLNVTLTFSASSRSSSLPDETRITPNGAGRMYVWDAPLGASPTAGGGAIRL